jgi:hypothetical protein
MTDNFFYGLENRLRSIRGSNFLGVYIFCRKWNEKILGNEPILKDESMNFLADNSKTFLNNFWIQIEKEGVVPPGDVKKFVSEMITEDGGLSIQITRPDLPDIFDYYDAFWEVLEAMVKEKEMKRRLLDIFDEIFKYFIPETFAWDDERAKVYASFSMLVTSDSINFTFYRYKDVLNAPSSNIEDFFDFSLVSSPVPHLKINQRVSNIPGHAQRMGTQIISIFHRFQNLQYIETDTVNPITYHISVKQGFEPVCAIDSRKRCILQRNVLLERIRDKYTEIVSGSDGPLSDQQRKDIANLFNVEDPDNNDFQGVKMHLSRPEATNTSYNKAYMRRSDTYFGPGSGKTNGYWGGAQRRPSPSPGSAMALISGCAWLVFASLLGSGPHRYFLP